MSRVKVKLVDEEVDPREQQLQDGTTIIGCTMRGIGGVNTKTPTHDCLRMLLGAMAPLLVEANGGKGLPAGIIINDLEAAMKKYRGEKEKAVQ
jgi:hypothetical protein